jgi:hypothetical protein
MQPAIKKFLHVSIVNRKTGDYSTVSFEVFNDGDVKSILREIRRKKAEIKRAWLVYQHQLPTRNFDYGSD